MFRVSEENTSPWINLAKFGGPYLFETACEENQ